MFTWCRKQKASILIFLQEKHSTVDKENNGRQWGAPLEFAHWSINARGAAILLRNRCDCKIREKIVDPMGRNLGIEADRDQR